MDQKRLYTGRIQPLKHQDHKDENHSHDAESQPWEYTDGCIYLVREISQNKPTSILEFLPVIAEIANLPIFFNGQYHLLETIWALIPSILKVPLENNLLKKNNLDSFLNLRMLE